MPANKDKPDRWKQDIATSVDHYNDWFMRFAPEAYRTTRREATEKVENALVLTDNLRNITSELLLKHPEILPILRMSTAPPIARDRLIGLASVAKNLVESMEGKPPRKKAQIPPQMSPVLLMRDLERIGELFRKIVDLDIFSWLETGGGVPRKRETYRAATIVADRLCGAIADPIIRNAQEKRQLALIAKWLGTKGYRYVPPSSLGDFRKMQPGTFTNRLNAPVTLGGTVKPINIAVDVVIMPSHKSTSGFPLLLECKSAGDYTNTNKRRKEEAAKLTQLRSNYGKKIQLVLFLCGYFDSGYLGYEAAEGLDWVWEHRIEDLASFGI